MEKIKNKTNNDNHYSHNKLRDFQIVLLISLFKMLTQNQK